MQKNQDPKVIVMGREMFATLLRSASSHYDLNPVIEHARRFNPHYNEEWKRRKAALLALQKEQHQKVRDLIRRKLGKVVYLRHPGQLSALIPATVLGRGLRDKGQVRLHYDKPGNSSQSYPFPARSEPGNYDIDIDRIVEEKPEGWQLVKGGQYNGCYMFAWDPHETQQEE